MRSRQIGQTPHASLLLQPPDDYRLASPVSALAAGFLHLTSVRTFLAFHLVIAVLAVISPFALPRVRASRELRSLMTLLLIGSAIPAVLFGWVGGYDAVTVASLSVAILADYLVASFSFSSCFSTEELRPRVYLSMSSMASPGFSPAPCTLPHLLRLVALVSAGFYLDVEKCALCKVDALRSLWLRRHRAHYADCS